MRKIFAIIVFAVTLTAFAMIPDKTDRIIALSVLSVLVTYVAGSLLLENRRIKRFKRQFRHPKEAEKSVNLYKTPVGIGV